MVKELKIKNFTFDSRSGRRGEVNFGSELSAVFGSDDPAHEIMRNKPPYQSEDRKMFAIDDR